MTTDKIVLTILIVLLNITARGQVFSVDFVVTNKEQNDLWLKNLETMEHDKQVELIQSRLLTDTITYVGGFSDRVKLKPLADSLKVDVYCRPLIILNGEVIDIKNNTPTIKVKELVSLLTPNEIGKVEIVKDDKATALYGSQGLCGLILLTTTDKRIKRKINKIGI